MSRSTACRTRLRRLVRVPAHRMVVVAAPPVYIAVAAFLVNARHTCYALSFPLERVRGRLAKAYSTFSLTDEAYASHRHRAFPRLARAADPVARFFTHLYRAGSATAGALLGSLIPDSVTGLDFALTALFAVLALDAVRDLRRGPAHLRTRAG
ncbi:hypothetical protein EAO68_24140 [Streptomyces sp. wa22]|nr:hypothetical protein EAO68_24140 [Streptomyces sp. wa22]